MSQTDAGVEACTHAHTHTVTHTQSLEQTYLSDLACSSSSGRGQHEREEQLVLLGQAALHLVKHEVHGKGGEQAQADAHIGRPLTGINAVVKHGDEGRQGGLVHGRNESQISHHKVHNGGPCSCGPVLLPSLQHSMPAAAAEWACVRT